MERPRRKSRAGAGAMEEFAVLPSWNDGPAKAAILDFVRSATTPGEAFVRPAERDATFDNDGTLWCERPLYIQAEFVFRRFIEMVRDDPRSRRAQAVPGASGDQPASVEVG